MAQAEKCCILAIDVSGSVMGFEFYWTKVNELLSDVLRKGYSDYKVIAWSTDFKAITLDQLRECIDSRATNYGGGTSPGVYIQEQVTGSGGKKNNNLYVNFMVVVVFLCFERYKYVVQMLERHLFLRNYFYWNRNK